MTSSLFHTHFEGKESHTTPQAHRLWSTTEDSCLGATSDGEWCQSCIQPSPSPSETPQRALPLEPSLTSTHTSLDEDPAPLH